MTPESGSAQEGGDFWEYTATLTDSPKIPAGVTYAWSFKAPPGVGNNPSVTFDAPAESTTKVVRAHWYAQPDIEWANEVEFDCPYTITCKVSGCNYEIPPEDSAEFRVQLVYGGLTTINPMYSGEVTIEKDVTTDEWYVKDQGTLKRRTDFPVTYGAMYPESEFIDKVDAHERHHVTQFESIAPWKDMWDVDTFFTNELLGLRNISLGNLDTLVKDLLATWNDEQISEYQANRCEMEWQACQAGNQVAPPYMNFRRDDVPKIWQCEF